MDNYEAAEIAKKFEKRLIYDNNKVNESICQFSNLTTDRLLILTNIIRLVDSLPAFSMDDLILKYRAENDLYIELITELARKNSSSIYRLTEL